MNFKWKLLFFIFLFIFVIGLMIISNNNLNIAKASDRAILFKAYVSWISNLKPNIDLNAFAVKKEWLPDEEINLSINENNSVNSSVKKVVVNLTK